MIGKIIRDINRELNAEKDTGQKENSFQLLTGIDVSKILACSHHQVYRYIRAGIFEKCLVQIGNRTIRFHPKKLQRLIEMNGLKI